MKILTGSVTEIITLNEKINSGLKETVPGYEAESYSDVIINGDTASLIIDESDPRNPVQFLSEDEKNKLQKFEG